MDLIISKNLKRIRLSKGWTQQTFSEATNIRPTELSMLENNHKHMGKAVMERICNALKIRPYEFYMEDAPRPESDQNVTKIISLFTELNDYNKSRALEDLEMRVNWQQRGVGRGVKDSGHVQWGLNDKPTHKTKGSKRENKTNSS